ncbi:MAG: hypothetical protein Q9173_003088 [Seirophora scorigena]
MHTTGNQACGAIGAINCAFVTTLAPKSGLQPQACDILKMCLWKNKYCDCIDYSGDHHGKRALLEREDGQPLGYQAWRFAIVLAVFWLLVATVTANLVVGVKVYRMLRRKRREQWMELRKRDLEGTDGVHGREDFEWSIPIWYPFRRTQQVLTYSGINPTWRHLIKVPASVTVTKARLKTQVRTPTSIMGGALSTIKCSIGVENCMNDYKRAIQLEQAEHHQQLGPWHEWVYLFVWIMIIVGVVANLAVGIKVWRTVKQKKRAFHAPATIFARPGHRPNTLTAKLLISSREFEHQCAARDEADAGPDILIEDATSATGDGRGAGNLDDPETAVRNGPGTSLKNDNEEETSTSIAEDVEFNEYVQPTDQSMGRDAPDSADGSLSIPDDTPSLQGSVTSSASTQARQLAHGRSPTPSMRPFDRRFQARLSPSPQSSPRAASPAFLHPHSRTTSVSSQVPDQTPWEVVRWTRLRKISGQAFSEVGKRSFGRPICIAISTTIAMGTSKGIILVFDYNQNLKSIIGPGTRAVESGAVTSISISADHSTVAGGHASGHIFTWELAKPAKPFLHIPPVDRRRTPDAEGHVTDVAILHLGFLGQRHTALVSADDKGMAFSHLATRGMGIVARTVKVTRILGRYPEATPSSLPQRKPSSVLAFSPLPLGNAEQASDTLGLVAMLTPYLLVIVSTTPIAQTQHKTPRPKEVAAHSAMTAALAWFPSVKLKTPTKVTAETSSKVKLVYCWSNVLTVLEIVEVEPSASSGADEPPILQFRPRSRWKAREAIVAVQWLGRSVLAVLTITQQLIILEDNSLRETNSSDLIQKHIYHVDLFSQQLNMLVEHLDEEDASMHGVVADAFYMSFRAYKGRLFLLGFNELSFGTLSNWADRLLALVEEGNHIGAIELAVSYYTGETDKVSVGLPDDDDSRHRMVLDKLLEMMSASLRYTFGKHQGTEHERPAIAQLQELAGACTSACVSIQDMSFLFDEVSPWFQEAKCNDIFLQTLEPFIMDNEIQVVPPIVVKDLVYHYTQKSLDSRLEEMLCHLDPRTMDLDQINGLCKRNHLYDALLYVWNEALNDYTTVLQDLLNLTIDPYIPEADVDPSKRAQDLSDASRIFPYLSYILTSRVYPTGREMVESKAKLAKAEIYNFFFSGSSNTVANADTSTEPSESFSETSFLNLRKVLDFDASSFLSMLNEAFEDSFLDDVHDQIVKGKSNWLTDTQKFDISFKRQSIVEILLRVMLPPRYEAEDTIYLDMFIARNVPKFRQFILLPGNILHRVLVGLCEYPADDIADDCQLSVEYLLSVHQPPDMQSLIPLLSEAGFFRVLRSIYRSEKEYAKLVQTCFDEGPVNGSLLYECVAECLRASAELSDKQVQDVRVVIEKNASFFVERDVKVAAATIEDLAPSMHGTMLEALSTAEDDDGQLAYLQTILEPFDQTVRGSRPSIKNPKPSFIELYVRLLCEYNPHHVHEYIEHLKIGDLRLEEVMPALESSGVIDAAVILMAREGKVREAMNRLTQQLDTLEAALLGLLDAAVDSPDVANTAEAAHDLVTSVRKFTRVGIWLCEGQTRSAQQRKSQLKRLKRAKSENIEFSISENLWLDLIDAVVKVTKQVTGTLQPPASDSGGSRRNNTEKPHVQLFETSKLMADLRIIVQETFTALLSATSVPADDEALRSDASFLRILRAFLKRASASSPSLANLRSVLSTIFSAYSYEESLLALANRLLDKDLFVHVEEADKLRRRGWRALGQVCEACGKRVWGPGTGESVWEAWQQREEEDAARVRRKCRAHPVDEQMMRSQPNGKGKVVLDDAQRGSASGGRKKQAASGTVRSEDTTRPGGGDGGAGPLIIFSCRHMFHQMCLEEVQESGEVAKNERRHDDYRADRFFDMFTFDTSDDPTHGYVNYVDQSTAQSSGLIDTNGGAVSLRVDSSKVASGRGRDSVRLTSKASYSHALVVLDLAHMPGNACGLWPAFWTNGPSWPSTGEIDIIEGVNMQSMNQATMHTGQGCSLAGSPCGSGAGSNEGCPLKGGAFGDGFNSGDGGVYAMEWTSSGIFVWSFDRGQEPSDILGNSPDPKGWGDPTASFEGGSSCDIDRHFKDHQIIFTTTFCGDWAGKKWSEDSTCSAKASTCEEYVQNNPEAFAEAFWKINALKVYSSDGSVSSSGDSPSQVDQPASVDKPVMTPFVEGAPVTTSWFAPVTTQTVEGSPVFVTIYARSPPEHDFASSSVDGKRRVAVPGEHKTDYSASPVAQAHEDGGGGDSEATGRRRGGTRREQRLAEHIRALLDSDLGTLDTAHGI